MQKAAAQMGDGLDCCLYLFHCLSKALGIFAFRFISKFLANKVLNEPAFL